MWRLTLQRCLMTVPQRVQRQAPSANEVMPDWMIRNTSRSTMDACDKRWSSRSSISGKKLNLNWIAIRNSVISIALKDVKGEISKTSSTIFFLRPSSDKQFLQAIYCDKKITDIAIKRYFFSSSCDLKISIHGYFSWFWKAKAIFCQKKYCFCQKKLSLCRNIDCKNCSSDEGLKYLLVKRNLWLKIIKLSQYRDE